MIMTHFGQDAKVVHWRRGYGGVPAEIVSDRKCASESTNAHLALDGTFHPTGGITALPRRGTGHVVTRSC